jgi:HEAT repeat protein
VQQWQDVVRNLRHPDPKVRLAAVEALGNSRYLAAVEPLAPLIGDPDDRVQFAAIDAELMFFLLEPIGGPRVQNLTSSSSRAQMAFDTGPFARTAAPAPPALVDALIAAVRDDQARIRFDAIHALGVIAQQPLTPVQVKGLIDQLDHYEPVIRVGAARVVGRLRVREAGAALIAGMNDSSDIVRQFAIESLGLIREERAVASLIEFVKHYRKGEIASSALLALARIGHGSARDLFRERVTDADPVMRRAAVEGLGRLADRDSLGQLHSMVQADPSPVVRLAAAFAVWRLGEPRLPLIAAAVGASATTGQAVDYLLELGSGAVAAVQAAVGSTTDANARASLIHVLGFIGGADTIPALQPYVHDKAPGVAHAAANAVSRLTK